MGITKAKTAKEINAEIKAKRNPEAVEPVVEDPKDAPVGVEDTNDAGAAESSEEAKDGLQSADNAGASDSEEETEDQKIPGPEAS